MAMRRSVTVASCLVVLGLLTGCRQSNPPQEDFSLDACSLVEERTVEALIGPVKATDETSVDLNGPESNWAQCRYLPAGRPGAALGIRVEHGDPKDVALVEASGRQCQDHLPLAVDGVTGYLCGDPTGDGNIAPYALAVWGEGPAYYASLTLSPRNYAPKLPEAAEPLRAAVRHLVENVDESSFTPR